MNIDTTVKEIQHAGGTFCTLFTLSCHLAYSLYFPFKGIALSMVNKLFRDLLDNFQSFEQTSKGTKMSTIPHKEALAGMTLDEINQNYLIIIIHLFQAKTPILHSYNKINTLHKHD